MKKYICLFIILIIVILLFSFKENYVTKEIESKLFDIDSYSEEEYYGYLIIPSINMNLGFYNYDSPLNNVEYNIELIKIPVEGSYLIAGHSGVGKKAYFNDLSKLEEGDIIYLDINNEKNKYIITSIYRVKKTGNINIKNNTDMLYLTTCDQVIDGYQLVIEGIKE